VARLTLLNAWCGGEPSRLLLKEWKDAENDVWLPNSTINAIEDPAEQVLVGKFKIAYQAGKGKQHLVSLLRTTVSMECEFCAVKKCMLKLEFQCQIRLCLRTHNNRMIT